MMHLTEDYRNKKKGDDDDDSDDPAETDKDEKALELDGKNPLAEEESVEEDDNGGD